MDSKKELWDIITKYSLNEGDKKIWNDFIKKVPEKEIIPVLEFVKESPEDINTLTKNLKDKLWALKAQDKNSLDVIIDEEKDYLEKL